MSGFIIVMFYCFIIVITVYLYVFESTLRIITSNKNINTAISKYRVKACTPTLIISKN